MELGPDWLEQEFSWTPGQSAVRPRAVTSMEGCHISYKGKKRKDFSTYIVANLKVQNVKMWFDFISMNTLIIQPWLSRGLHV